MVTERERVILATNYTQSREQEEEEEEERARKREDRGQQQQQQQSEIMMRKHHITLMAMRVRWVPRCVPIAKPNRPTDRLDPTGRPGLTFYFPSSEHSGEESTATYYP